ncbi:MAG TPA: Gfo/Idh/MocA family oxidoreductase [Solirubrobacteraceae bacterium]|jgi:predicted dehydrogenase|nr:Gfo/Idh/MocA family oxidoreductase [Solirubrobacteraceae bacterium]
MRHIGGTQSKRFVRARYVGEADKIRPLMVAVVGYGYWGPNLVRNVVASSSMELAALCERDQTRADAFRARMPGVRVESDFDELLLDASIDAVIVATPPTTHYALCKQALLAGKHVLVEKPMAKTSSQARELKQIADQRGLVMMPGHTFLYSPAVNKVRDLINEDAVGEVYFVTSSRMNLGNYQADGVVCDLAPHDLSILMHWLDRPVVQVAAAARTIFQDHVTETAFITLTFEDGANANIQISWLAPRKVRQMLIVGSRRMISYDDTLPDEAVRLYDRGMEFTTPESYGEYQLTYRSGDVIIPRIEPAEPLALELHDFARAMLTGSTPVSHAQLGVDVVTAMEAIELSLARGGEPVTLGPGAATGDAAATAAVA